MFEWQPRTGPEMLRRSFSKVIQAVKAKIRFVIQSTRNSFIHCVDYLCLPGIDWIIGDRNALELPGGD